MNDIFASLIPKTDLIKQFTYRMQVFRYLNLNKLCSKTSVVWFQVHLIILPITYKLLYLLLKSDSLEEQPNVWDVFNFYPVSYK